LRTIVLVLEPMALLLLLQPPELTLRLMHALATLLLGWLLP
jgi:hypothetical protein